jgi:outer membrane lipoprotein-sorting protein
MLKNRIPVLMLFIVMAILLSCGPVFAADTIEQLQDRILDKQAKVQQDIRDLTIATETHALQGPARSMLTASVRNIIKGNKIRTQRDTFQPEQGKENHMIAVCNGEQVWVVIPGEFKVQIPIESIDKKSGFYFWWLPSFSQAKLVGVEKLLDRELLVIEFNKKPQEQGLHKVWVDKDTLALIKAERITSTGNVMVSVFSRFKTLAPGYEIAHKGSTFINDQLFDRYKVTSLEINTGVSDDIFESTSFTEPERTME